MKIEIYSKVNCKFCNKAKQELKNRGLKYEEYDVSIFEIKEELFDRAPQNIKTVPQIFINNKYIGGYTQLMDYFDDHGMNV